MEISDAEERTIAGDQIFRSGTHGCGEDYTVFGMWCYATYRLSRRDVNAHLSQ